MSEPAAPMLTYRPPSERRRRVLWLLAIMLVFAGVIVRQNRQDITEWAGVRRMTYTAYTRQQRCMRMSPDKFAAVTLTNADQFINCRPALLPGNKWAVVAGDTLGLYLFDLTPTHRVLRIDGVSGEVTDMAVSPDGATLAVSTKTGLFVIRIADIESAARALPPI